MNKFPFKSSPAEAVYICSHLLEEGGQIETVYHLDSQVFAWSFLCGAAKHSKDEIVESTLGQVYKKFPQIAGLAQTPLNMMMKKGKEGGAWYAFVVKPQI